MLSHNCFQIADKIKRQIEHQWFSVLIVSPTFKNIYDVPFNHVKMKVLRHKYT